jgi:CSLREA domain-containing protein
MKNVSINSGPSKRASDYVSRRSHRNPNFGQAELEKGTGVILRKTARLALVLFAGVVFLHGSTMLAATLTVTSAADSGGPCPGAATCTLRQAINDAASGDTIDFAASITAITLTSDQLLIDKNLTVNGPGASGLTVQRSTAQNTPDFRIFDIAANTTVTISGLTITGGSAPQNGNAGTETGNTGGGIFNAGTLTIADSAVTNNQTSLSPGMGYGGGIFNNGSLTITNSAITNNQTSPSESAGFGGGIANSGSLLIKGSTLSGNKVGDNPTAAYFSSPTAGGGGGAIYSSSGNVTIANSTLSDNRAGKGATSTNSFNGDGGDGGAIFYRGSTLIIVNSTVSGNRAGDGGGSGAQMGDAGLGGGITNIGTATIMNCTITANQAGDGAVANTDDGSGGGILNNGTLTILGNIIAGNSTVAAGAIGPDIRGGGSGNIKSDGYNLIQDPSGATITPNPNAGPDMTGVDPRLGPLGDNGGPTQTHLLLPDSPAIDAGNPSALPPDTYDLNNNGNTSEPLPVDQRGFARVVNSKFDIGAVEVSYSINATAGTPQSAAINSAFPTNLQATVEESNIVRSGLTVTFTAPSSGPSGAFPGGSTTATATTNINGIATAPTFTANNIVGGPYTVSATLGTGLPTAAFSLTNTKVDQTITVTTHAPAAATFNSSFTVAATASSGLPITYSSAGSCTNSGATFTMTSGTGTCTVNYDQAGDASYNPAPRATEMVAAQKAATSTGVTSSMNPSIAGQNVTFTATVTSSAGSPTGTVQFVVDGSNFGGPVTLSGGTAQTSTSSLTPLNHTVSAQYSGDANFDTSSGSLPGGQTVVPAPTPTPTPAPTPAPTATPTPTPGASPAQALNISTRLMVQTGDKVMIGGFIVTGNASKPVVLRGLGPSLVNSGMPPVEVLNDPVLELHGPDGALITVNDNWKDSPQRSQIEGTVYQPTDDRESVIVATLSPGNYTAILTGKNQTTGVGLVEVYDHDTTVDSSLANISTRGFVQTADNVMIGGFMLGNNPANAHIAVRGIGPSLTSFGLSNVLADPTLDLHDANGTIMISNDNWTDDPVSAAQLTANGLALKDPRESGIFMSLPPGTFTAILAGKNGGVGIGLVEIYNVK